MANEHRVRTNNMSGTITNNPLDSLDVTINSAEFAALPVIDSTQHMVITLDPLGEGNGPERYYCVAHTAAGTGMTAVRGREGSSPVDHPLGTPWICAPVASDMITICTTVGRPSGGGLPYIGQPIYDVTVAQNMWYNGSAWQGLVPSGIMVEGATMTAPPGWLLCDGSAISRVTYADLFAAIGDDYGPGDGITTFNLPDHRGAASVCLDDLGTAAGAAGLLDVANTLGLIFGEQYHQMLLAEIATHTHVQNAHTHTQNSHTHSMTHTHSETTVGAGSSIVVGGGAGGNVTGTTGAASSSNTGSQTATNQNTTAVNQNTGSGDPFNVVQPSVLVTKIIKA